MRLLWHEEFGRIDASRLVFVDEMGTHTSLAPLYAYAPVGQRAFFEIPRNRGANTTLLTSLDAQGMGPSMAVEGATTARVFEAYTERLLVPALRPGQGRARAFDLRSLCAFLIKIKGLGPPVLRS